MNTQKGFGTVLLILFGIVLIGSGGYVYTQQKKSVDLVTNTEAEVNITTSVSVDDKITMEKKVNDAQKTINDSVEKNLVSETNVKVDTQGNLIPSLIIDPDIASDLVAEKYGSDPVYVRQMIRTRLMAIAAGLRTQASIISNQNNGSYAKVCDVAKEYFTSEVYKTINSGDEFDESLLAKLGVTVESYRISESLCKSNDSAYVATIPFTLEDGTNTKYCMSNSGSVYGEADFDTMTCIKKY